MDSYSLNKPVPTTNTFGFEEVLNDININGRVEKIVKLPLIFVTGVHNFQPVSQLLQKISISHYEIKITKNEQVKI